ncbi:MAG: phage tail protein [Oligoflexus sp.]
MIEASEAVPAGTVVAFSGPTLPEGWLMCWGQEVSRSLYSELFDSIGTTYGSGDGSTTFNLPDLRGRVIAGRDDPGDPQNRLTSAGAGIDSKVLGAVGGAQTHALTTAQLAAHSHTFNKTELNTNQTSHRHDIRHTHKVMRSYSTRVAGYTTNDRYSTADPGDTPTNSVVFHDPYFNGATFTGTVGYAGTGKGGSVAVLYTSGVTSAPTGSGSTAESGTGLASWTSANVTTSTALGSSSNGSAHQNTQPTIVQNYLIKALNIVEINSRLFVKRINQSVRINNVIVSPIEQGTSGEFEIDIKKGSSAATATQTIFSVKPSLSWDDTTPQSGTTDSNQNLVEADQYIVISVESTQANLKAVHLYVSGDL